MYCVINTWLYPPSRHIFTLSSLTMNAVWNQYNLHGNATFSIFTTTMNAVWNQYILHGNTTFSIFITTINAAWNQYILHGNAISFMTQDSSVLQPCSIVILAYRVIMGHFIWGNSPSTLVPYCIYIYLPVSKS